MEIVDAHHHIWQMKNLPWLVGEPVPRIFGEYDSIRRDYPIEEYLTAVRPKIILWAYFDNDLSDLEQEKGNPFRPGIFSRVSPRVY